MESPDTSSVAKSSSPIRLAIVGASGRMGTSLLENAARRDEFEVTCAIVSSESSVEAFLGPGHLRPTDDISALADTDVAIDFSAPTAFLDAARQCANAGVPLISGTTGLSAEQWQEIEVLSKDVAILYAANFSVGVNLLAHLVEEAASGFGDAIDIEIFEAHHRHKVDAPSGTAKLLGRAAASGRNLDLDKAATWTRHGHTGPRAEEEIGFQVLRGGDIVGEHTAYFCAEGERLELTHRATDRGIFARGALRAARWIDGRPPGRYDMSDVLFGD